MKGYKCNLKIDELNKLRDDFWNRRVHNTQPWKIIHQACMYDYIKAEEYLYKNNIRTFAGCLNCCIDSVGTVYHVPNFCINDPYFELEVLPTDDENHKKKIVITILDVNNGKADDLEVNEDMTGEELKLKYAANHSIDLAKNRIRFLFGGGIIKDSEELYQHKIKKEFSIQACFYQIE